MSFCSSDKNYGFTLIELIITLAIAGILFSIALPTFSQVLAKNQQQTTLYRLFSHHQLARSEAIKTNQTVILCKSNDGQQCDRQAEWSDGWMIFTDHNNNKKLDADERMIYTQASLNNRLSLSYRGFGSHNYVRYFPSGQSTSNGTFTLCNQEGKAYSKALIISRTGRVRIDTRAPGNRALQCS